MLIYAIENSINGKKYYGQTHFSLEKRWKEHVSKLSAMHPLYHAMRKYGVNKFCIRLIDTAQTQVELDEKERHYITRDSTDDRRFGYNLDLGGRRQGKVSIETRAKISAGLVGNTNTLGKSYSELVKKATSFRMKGHQVSHTTRKKISEKLTGRKLSQQHKLNISESRKSKFTGTELIGKPGTLTP